MDPTYQIRDLGLETAVVSGPEETVKCVCLGPDHVVFALHVITLLNLEQAQRNWLASQVYQTQSLRVLDP